MNKIPKVKNVILPGGVLLPKSRQGLHIIPEKTPVLSDHGILNDPLSHLDPKRNFHADTSVAAALGLAALDQLRKLHVKLKQAEKFPATLGAHNLKLQEQQAVWSGFMAERMNLPEILAMGSHEDRQVRRLRTMMRAAGVSHPDTYKVLRNELRRLRNA